MVRGVRVRWVKLSQWASSRVRARENVAGAGCGGLASEWVRSEPVCGASHGFLGKTVFLLHAVYKNHISNMERGFF